MVKVIDGKRYNTNTATEIDHYWNGLSSNDFRNVSESLYVTKKGNFFLYGEGGPMSKYAVSNGNLTSGSTNIIPLNKEDAFKWCERYSNSEIIDQYFPDLVEDA